MDHKLKSSSQSNKIQFIGSWFHVLARYWQSSRANIEPIRISYCVFRVKIQTCHHSIQTFKHAILRFKHSILRFKHSILRFKHSILRFKHSVLQLQHTNTPSFVPLSIWSFVVAFIIRCSLGPSSVKLCFEMKWLQLQTQGRRHIKECMGNFKLSSKYTEMQ